MPGGQGCVQRQRCAFRRAVHPPHKGVGMGAGEAFFQMIEGADVAADAKNHAGLLSAAQFGRRLFSCCMKVTGNSGQYVQIHRVRLEVSAHFVYNEL